VRTAAILTAEGKSREIDEVFQAVHRNDPDPKLLAYQYLQVLPQLAQGRGSTFWVIPSEVTAALNSVSRAFTNVLPTVAATTSEDGPGDELAATAAADAARAAEAAAAAVADAVDGDHGLPGAGDGPGSGRPGGERRPDGYTTAPLPRRG
jgi:hypothetical protein